MIRGAEDSKPLNARTSGAAVRSAGFGARRAILLVGADLRVGAASERGPAFPGRGDPIGTGLESLVPGQELPPLMQRAAATRRIGRKRGPSRSPAVRPANSTSASWMSRCCRGAHQTVASGSW